MNTFRKFDPRFDDVFSSPTLSHLYRPGRGVIDENGTKAMFALSFFFGERLIAPANLLIDHKPIIRLLQVPQWRDFLFRQHVLRIGRRSSVRNWNEFRTIASGGGDYEPLGMTSDEDLASEIQKMAKGGQPKATIQAAWFEAFPHAVEFIDTVEAEPEYYTVPYEFEGPYTDYLIPLLQNPEKVYRIREDYFSALLDVVEPEDIRTQVFEKINKLGLSREQANNLKRIATDAKHRQYGRAFDAEYLSKILDGSETAIFREQKFDAAVEVFNLPVLPKVLNGTISIEELKKLAEDEEFLGLRNQFVEARRADDIVALRESLIKLCERADKILMISVAAKVLVLTGVVGKNMALSGLVEVALGEITAGFFLLGIGGIAIVIAAKGDRATMESFLIGKN